jgi:HlyD family secretion protein
MRVQGSGFRVQAPRLSRQWLRIISTQYFVLGSMLAAVAAFHGSAMAQTPGSSSGSLEVVVAGKPVKKTLSLVTTQPARIEALEQAPIHSKIAAYVGEVLVDFGDKVKKDQPLVKLHAREVDAEVAQKRALLEQARAHLLQAEAGAKAAEAAVNTASAKAVQAEAASERAKSDTARWQSEFSRISQLVSGGSVNRQLLDETQQKFGAAEASLREALAAISAAKALVAQSQAEAAKAASDVTAAGAQVRVAEANLAQSAAMQDYLTIKSPFDGVVTSRRVDPGHFVQPATSGTGPLLMVSRYDKMRVFVAVPEMDAAYVDLTDPVTVDVQSLRGAEFKGTVTRTSFALDADNRSLNTIIDIDNAGGRLRPGLYATAKILLQEQKDALTLPAAAVVRQGKEAFCYRLIGGKAAKTPIQFGIKVGDDFEITGGLSENDSVILNKAASLKDAQPVEVLKAEAKK